MAMRCWFHLGMWANHVRSMQSFRIEPLARNPSLGSEGASGRVPAERYSVRIGVPTVSRRAK